MIYLLCSRRIKTNNYRAYATRGRGRIIDHGDGDVNDGDVWPRNRSKLSDGLEERVQPP